MGTEHAHFPGHWHGHVNTLRAILEYAVVVNDPRLKAFARDGYEWARQSGLVRIGMLADNQGCACGCHSGHLPFSGLVARVAFQDEPDMVDGTMNEDVSRDKSHRTVMLLKEFGEKFAALPPGGGKRPWF